MKDEFKELAEERLRKLKELLQFYDEGICNLTSAQKKRVVYEIDIISNLLELNKK